MLALVALIALAGCGGGTVSAGTGSSGSSNQTVTDVRSTALEGSSGRVLSAAVTAKRSGQRPRRSGSASVASTGSPHRFTILLSSVCSAVLAGAPAFPQTPVTSSMARKYARHAEPVARRAWVSLERLGRETGRISRVRRLRDGYRELTRMYLTAASSRFSKARARLLREQLAAVGTRIEIAARQAAVPSCAPSFVSSNGREGGKGRS